MIDVVHVWLPAEIQPAPRPDHEMPTAPAIQAWADALLEIASARFSVELQPPISVRKHSLFGWLTEVPPSGRAALTVGRVVHRVRVDPRRCAIARIDIIDELVDPESWQRLAEYLVDRGYDRATIEEELVPVTAPMARALVDRARPAVESTKAELVDELIGYFSEAIRQYLASWQLLADFADNELAGEWEVIVPPDGFLETLPS